MSAPRSDPARSMSDNRPTTAPKGEGLDGAAPRAAAGGWWGDGVGLVSLELICAPSFQAGQMLPARRCHTA